MRWGPLPALYRRLLAVLGALLLIAGVWWLLAAGSQGIAVATVLTLAVGILTLAVAWVGLPGQRPVDDPVRLAAQARSLARDAAAQEADQQLRLLADEGKPRPADVGFRQPELAYWRSDGGEDEGRLTDIKGFYDGLGYGRLVILGAAGAGKTVLAGQLLLDLVRDLPAADPPPGTPLRVPVRLSLPSFNPGDDLALATPRELRGRLESWIGGQLRDVYGVEPRTAEALIRHGWLIPVLDGLDEMDAGAGDPRRAAAVIRALNHTGGTDPRPVVITCRDDRYDELTRFPAAAGQRPVLQDATVVRIQPLSATDAAAYLTYRFPDPARPGRIQPRWEPVLEAIGDGRQGPLTVALSSPLRLFLAITAYYHPASTPVTLTTFSDQPALEYHLISKLIPATTSGGPYRETDVARWLTTLAAHLKRQKAAGGSGTDIDLPELWTAAGDRARYLGAAIHVLLTGIPLLGLAIWYHSNSNDWIAPDLQNRLSAGAGVCLLIYACWVASRKEVRLARTDLSRLHTAAGRRRLVRGVMFGVAAGFVLGLAGGLVFVQHAHNSPGGAIAASQQSNSGGGAGSNIVGGIALGSALGLALGLETGLEQPPTAISRPRQLITQGLTHHATILLGYGLLTGTLTGLTGGTAGHRQLGWALGQGFTFRLAGGFAFGLAAGIAIAMGWLLSDSPWLRYFVATRILARRNELPPHPARFLDWAYGAGLLRLSGISAQFRHGELQRHLTPGEAPDPAETSSAAAQKLAG
jgi:hypothetical protein